MSKSLPSNNLGTISIEDCSIVSMNELLISIKNDYSLAIEKLYIEVAGVKVKLLSSLLASGGKRLWFQCPNCKRRVYKLRVHPDGSKVGCQSCLGLLYKKQRYKGMVEESAIQDIGN